MQKRGKDGERWEGSADKWTEKWEKDAGKKCRQAIYAILENPICISTQPLFNTVLLSLRSLLMTLLKLVPGSQPLTFTRELKQFPIKKKRGSVTIFLRQSEGGKK